MFENFKALPNGQDARRLRQWAHWSVFNLFVVSALGVLLRYKGAFYLPAVNYKYLLNAHSHFAFSGWITAGLFTGCLYMLAAAGQRLSSVYRYLFWLNQLSAFGMLASFMGQGYGPVSIFFSAISVVFSYWFAIRYWWDSRRAPWPSAVRLCIRLALAFLVLSSAGPYLLAYSMSHGLGDMAFYYNAIYLYLHFQYNGWFSFGVIGIFLWCVHRSSRSIPPKFGRWFAGLMGAACMPAYCLSVLWTDPPAWVWAAAAVAGLLQLAALCIFLATASVCLRGWFDRQSRPVRLLWRLSLLAFVIKIVLQALSVIPSLGRVVFGFRPVIIAYLHLVLLGFVSLFLVGFLAGTGLVTLTGRPAKTALACFIGGVVANEAILLIQSLMAFAGHGWENSPYYLLAAAVLMFSGLLLFVATTRDRPVRRW